MENNNQSPSSPTPTPPPAPPPASSSSSSSSFTAQLFGDNDSQRSTTGIFASISPSPSTEISFRTLWITLQRTHLQPLDSHIQPWLLHSKSAMVARNSSLRFTQLMQYETFDSLVWSTIHGTSAENVSKNTAITNSGLLNMERRSIFPERIEPCPLSSSIYYGGQEDMYIRSSSDLTSKSYTKFFMKDGSKDDPNHLQSATRGNWWQGSLYY